MIFDDLAERFLSDLIGLGIPRPEAPEDVEPQLLRWLEEAVQVGGIGRPPVNALRFTGGTYRQRHAAVAAVVRIAQTAPEDWPLPWNCRAIRDRLRHVGRELDPSPALAQFLEARARKAVASACGRAIHRAADLVGFIDGGTPRVEDGDLVVGAFDVRLPLGKVMEAFNDDGIALWQLRASLEDGVNVLDGAIGARAEGLSPGFETGLDRLFAEGAEAGVEPERYVADLLAGRDEERWIGFVLSRLHGRAEARDAFEQGLAPSDWAAALLRLRGWTPEDARLLAGGDNDALFRMVGDAFPALATHASRCLEAAHPTSAAFVALCALRYARRLQATGRAMRDVERVGALRDVVGGLEAGATLLRLDELLSELPLGVRGSDRSWPHLGARAKACWLTLAFEAVEDEPAVAMALMEYLLARSTGEAFEDLEPLVERLARLDGGWEYLRWLRDAPDARTALRAGGTFDAMMLAAGS